MSFVERHQLWNEDDRAGARAMQKAVADSGVEVIRAAFADQHGCLRGKTVMADDLESLLTGGIGMTSTLLLKDTSHKTVFPVWEADAGFGEGRLTGAGDVVMVMDPASFRVVPWAPDHGLVLCDVFERDGTPLGLSSRGILKDALARLAERGYDVVTGLEVEFHVFTVEDESLELADAGQPGAPPKLGLVGHGYQYLSDDRYDELQEIFDAIRVNAREMGLPLRSLEIEFGPSQCEATFHPAGALEHADNMIRFRTLVRQVCRRMGLHATFMCRPRFDAAMASGWHLHQSLVDAQTGENLFVPRGGDETISGLGRHWIAGLLAHARASCLFSTPTVNGYKRYRPHTLAPDRIQWGRDNKGAMIRVLAGPGDPASRLENRIGEPAANPYLYIASQLLCGLDGIERALEPPEPVDRPYDADAERLPGSLLAAVEALRGSEFFRARLGDEFVDYLATIKQAEWDRYHAQVSEWEEREYLSLF